MQDFSSISVSSYEAGILADRLTEQSSEGWEVVAIVPTGSTVTAYLSRPADAATTADSAGAEEVADAVEPEPEAAEPMPIDEDEAEDSDEDSDEDEMEATPEDDADAETFVAEIVPEPATDATDEAGWATLADDVAESGDDEIVPSLPESASAVAEPEGSSPEPVAAVVAEAAYVSAEAAGGAAPAGWYADPSSRFELRYWDGAQWTEHVSRAGQQYTDPPVA